MEYTNAKENIENKKQEALSERESDSKGFSSYASTTKRSHVMKRLLVSLLMTICLVFAGAQSTPTTKASATCDLVCGEPFIDPNDGQCKVMCCPIDDQCMMPCELRPCQK